MTTALITGGTSGIGAGFARQLAREGANLVIVGRKQERLDAAAEPLLNDHGVSVSIMVSDLSTGEGQAAVASRLASQDEPIDLLVNNAGFGLDGTFLEIAAEQHAQMLRVNAEAVLRLSHAALGPMMARDRGAIINVASVAGFASGLRPSPTYAATKAFVIALSEGLALATSGSEVRVTAVCPGFVRTEFHERAGIDMSKLPQWMWTETDAVVEAALHGSRTGKNIVVPGYHYKLITAFARHAPRPLLRSAAKYLGRRSR